MGLFDVFKKDALDVATSLEHGALSGFHRAVDDLRTAKTTAEGVVTEVQGEIAELQAYLAEARETAERHERVATKIESLLQ